MVLHDSDTLLQWLPNPFAADAIAHPRLLDIGIPFEMLERVVPAERATVMSLRHVPHLDAGPFSYLNGRSGKTVVSLIKAVYALSVGQPVREQHEYPPIQAAADALGLYPRGPVLELRRRVRLRTKAP